MSEVVPSLQGCVIYARVSSHDQRASLANQIDALRQFCAARGIQVLKEISEVGSGLNGHRRKLIQLLKSPGDVAVVHRDRLMRFGVEYVEAALESSGRKLLVINESECEDDLVQDFTDVVTSMCARIYGRRSARLKAQRAIKAAAE